MSYYFDDFELDEAGFSLSYRQQPVALEPKAFDVLLYLIRHRERVVTKDELMTTFWQGRVIADATLNTCIRSVRRALDDDHKQQRYIQTIPKRGFQFVGTLHKPEEKQPAPATEPKPMPEGGGGLFSGNARRYWFTGVFVVLLAVLLIVS